MKNRYRVAYYNVGDQISFRLNGDKSRITSVIRGFEDSLIVFKHVKINPKEITHLYVDNKTRLWFILRYKYEKIFLIGGAGYLLIDLINTGELRHENLIVSGSLIAAGLLARWLISEKMKIKGKRRLIILHD